MTVSTRILTFVSLLFAGTLVADEWTMFHGPDGQNRSPETGLLTSWPDGGPKLLWKASGIGEGVSGYSSVTIQSGRLFTSGNRNRRSIVYCFDMNGGKLWEYDNGPAWMRDYPGTRSTPTVDGDYVYDFSPHGQLTCLTADKGERIWSRNVLTDFEGENIRWALAESILIDGDRLYCSPGGKRASFVALNKKTGETMWTTPALDASTAYGSPVIIEQDGLRMILTPYANGMFGVNAKNGEWLFTFKHIQNAGVNCARPIYHEGHVFFVNTLTSRGQGAILLKIIVDNNKVSLDEVWRNRDFDNLHDSVMLIDGFLYGTTSHGRSRVFICVDWKTGKTQYENRGVGGGSLTWAEGLLYFYSEDGNVLLMRPNPEKYDVISQFDLPEGGEGATWAHPVICGKRLYLRHGTFLYCYDIAQK